MSRWFKFRWKHILAQFAEFQFHSFDLGPLFSHSTIQTSIRIEIWKLNEKKSSFLALIESDFQFRDPFWWPVHISPLTSIWFWGPCFKKAFRCSYISSAVSAPAWSLGVLNVLGINKSIKKHDCLSRLLGVVTWLALLPMNWEVVGSSPVYTWWFITKGKTLRKHTSRCMAACQKNSESCEHDGNDSLILLNYWIVLYQ